MIKDGKLISIILAVLLITISSVAYYFFIDISDSAIKTSIIALSYAFTWLVLAWILTDKSFFRKPTPYVIVFLIFFIEKIIWSIYPRNLIMIFTEFLAILIIFTVFWYLTRPRDFTKFENKYEFIFSNRMFFILFGAFLMTIPLILCYIETSFYDFVFINNKFVNIESECRYFPIVTVLNSTMPTITNKGPKHYVHLALD